MSEQDILERVSAARTYLTAKVPFLGFLTLRMKPRITNEYDECKTAGVGPDGTPVLHPEFIAKQSDPELRGLLAHEVLHPALEFYLAKTLEG
jgi:predicted metal-dependent peptidase